jgi:hypothetical protein
MTHLHAPPPSFAGGNLDDLYQLDTASLRWTDLSRQASGPPPSSRFGAGFAAVAGSLFVFGGRNGTWGYDAGSIPRARGPDSPRAAATRVQ